MKNVYKIFEVTIKEEPISELEELFIEHICEVKGYNLVIHRAKRIMTLDNVKNIRECIKIIAQLGFAEEVGLIREITTYEPEIEVMDQIDLFDE